MKSSQHQIVDNARELLNDGYQVSIGRVGVDKMIEIDSIYVAEDTQIIVVGVKGAGPNDQFYLALDQLAVVHGRDTKNPLMAHIG